MEKPKILLPMDAPRDDLGIREVLHLLDGRVAEAATGLSHSAVVTDQGSLFTWGKVDDHGVCFTPVSVACAIFRLSTINLGMETRLSVVNPISCSILVM